MIATQQFAAAYRAKWVFTAQGEPLRDGVVIVSDGRLVHVGRDPHGSTPINLGDVAIVPGLVNAHTHLEFSDYVQPLPRGRSFADWIRSVVEARRAAFGNPNAASLARAAVARGLAESLSAGTVVLGEIASPSFRPEPFADSAAEAVIFPEVLGVAAERGAAALATAQAWLAGGSRPHSESARPLQFGVSPHAPYTVPTPLLDQTIAAAQTYRAPVAMHLAESPDEIELLATGRGPLRDVLEALGAFDAERLALYRSPAEYIERLARCERVLVVHGNYLDSADVAAIVPHRERMSVVYCPRTHAHFGFDRHPLMELRAAGVRVVVGTDSRASNPDLSVLSELKEVARRFPELPRDEVLAMGTREAALALGLGDRHGVLAADRPANLAVAQIDAEASDPYDALFADSSQITATMIDGAWVSGQINVY